MTVEADGSGDFADLEEAFSTVAAGSTIVLGPGTHTVTATLAFVGDITLTGAASADTIVTSTTGPVIEHGEGAFVASGITFRYEGTAPAGVAVLDDAAIDLADVVFTGGKVGESEDPSIGNGLLIGGASTGTIEGSAATDNGRDGFRIAGSAILEITRTRATGNGNHGFRWTEDSAGSGRRVRAEANGATGIYVQDRAAVDLGNCVASDNESSGHQLPRREQRSHPPM